MFATRFAENGVFAFDAELRREREQSSLSQNPNFARWNSHKDVIKFFVDGDGEVRGQRPRRCRPDEHECWRGGWFIAELGGKFYVDGWRLLLRIFDFRLRKRGAVVDAPIHGFEPVIDESFL